MKVKELIAMLQQVDPEAIAILDINSEFHDRVYDIEVGLVDEDLMDFNCLCDIEAKERSCDVGEPTRRHVALVRKNYKPAVLIYGLS